MPRWKGCFNGTTVAARGFVGIGPLVPQLWCCVGTWPWTRCIEFPWCSSSTQPLGLAFWWGNCSLSHRPLHPLLGACGKMWFYVPSSLVDVWSASLCWWVWPEKLQGCRPFKLKHSALLSVWEWPTCPWFSCNRCRHWTPCCSASWMVQYSSFGSSLSCRCLSLTHFTRPMWAALSLQLCAFDSRET